MIYPYTETFGPVENYAVQLCYQCGETRIADINSERCPVCNSRWGVPRRMVLCPTPASHITNATQSVSQPPDEWLVLGASRPAIIGITGTIGSGKSFAADHLVAKHGFCRKKMAGPLKTMLRSIGLTDAHIEGDLKEKPCELLCGQTPRMAMQTLGTEWGRDTIGADLWVRLWWESIKGEAKVVVDDVRFANEAQAVRDAGGVVVRLTTVEDIADAEILHESERQDFEADYTIFNPKTSALLSMLDLVVLKVS